MTKRSKFVLVGKEQKTMTSDEAARLVAAGGFVKAAAKIGVSESYLRKFLHSEGFRFKRRTSWQVEELPGMEVASGSESGGSAPAGPASPGEHEAAAS